MLILTNKILYGCAILNTIMIACSTIGTSFSFIDKDPPLKAKLSLTMTPDDSWLDSF